MELHETALFIYIRTQRHLRAAAAVQPGAVSAGERGAGSQQGPAAHPGRHRHPEEIPGHLKTGFAITSKYCDSWKIAAPPLFFSCVFPGRAI